MEQELTSISAETEAQKIRRELLQKKNIRKQQA